MELWTGSTDLRRQGKVLCATYSLTYLLIRRLELLASIASTAGSSAMVRSSTIVTLPSWRRMSQTISRVRQRRLLKGNIVANAGLLAVLPRDINHQPVFALIYLRKSLRLGYLIKVAQARVGNGKGSLPLKVLSFRNGERGSPASSPAKHLSAFDRQ